LAIIFILIYVRFIILSFNLLFILLLILFIMMVFPLYVHNLQNYDGLFIHFHFIKNFLILYVIFLQLIYVILYDLLDFWIFLMFYLLLNLWYLFLLGLFGLRDLFYLIFFYLWHLNNCFRFFFQWIMSILYGGYPFKLVLLRIFRDFLSLLCYFKMFFVLLFRLFDLLL
jgi:hypothetical protein